MITFCVICYGCRGKQINRTLSQLHFSSSHHAHISQTLILVFLSVFKLTGEEYSAHVKACLLSELNEKPSQWILYTWGIFKSIFHVIALPSVLLILLSIMFSVCLVNWPQMPVFYKEKYIFSAAMCLASPKSEVIIYLICSPNKLLTLIFVSQHVSSWFVIESQ